jgi:hypothetical protein
LSASREGGFGVQKQRKAENVFAQKTCRFFAKKTREGGKGGGGRGGGYNQSLLVKNNRDLASKTTTDLNCFFGFCVGRAFTRPGGPFALRGYELTSLATGTSVDTILANRAHAWPLELAGTRWSLELEKNDLDFFLQFPPAQFFVKGFRHVFFS